jgi:hypothetical protein
VRDLAVELARDRLRLRRRVGPHAGALRVRHLAQPAVLERAQHDQRQQERGRSGPQHVAPPSAAHAAPDAGHHNTRPTPPPGFTNS